VSGTGHRNDTGRGDVPDEVRRHAADGAGLVGLDGGESGRDTRYCGRVEQVRLIAVRDTPLSVDEVRTAIAYPAAGGEVLFIGTVRDNDSEKGVTALSYSAHPSAEKEMRRVAEETAAKYPDAIAVAAVHRIGDLNVGDLAVVVGVSCAHRAEAFHACHALIDELKATVPIWKHQRFTDGTDEWVGSA
jgi:molybdopterin synthase catalytic subunit